MSLALADLNQFLSVRSYVEGYVPSQADVAVFEHIVGQPVDSALNHVLRWQRHLASYSAADRTAFPGIKKSVDEYCISKSAAGAEKPVTAVADDDDDDDDDFDMFGGDDDPAEKQKQEELKQKLIKEAEERQKEKQKTSKSSIVLEVKPYDDEADHDEIEKVVRAVEMEGLLWGKSRLEEVAYGVKKLQISAVILDSVSTEIICEEIEKRDDIIQSTDIVAFQKI